MPTFGAWLKQRRLSLDLRQEELAERINCSAVTIRKIEAGKRRPSRQIAELLADYLQVPPDERTAFIHFARQEPSSSSGAPESTLHPSPWRSLYSQFSNVPAEPGDLIGRDSEVDDCLKLLRRDSVRLVTLTGPPGIGKTRLSLQLASELFADFENGTAFVGLARISQAEQVAAAVAETLGVREVPGQDPVRRLHQVLQDKRQLLVLDNFEHVLLAATWVAELLAACRWLKVLVTSRAALHVRGEHQFLVPPLALPDPAHAATAEEIGVIPSVALFVSRAQAVNRAFRLTDDNAATVGAVCTRLEGLPLAIELAAAHLNLLNLQDLQAQLEDRLTLLRHSAIDLPARHQTLHHAIAWSYDLLSSSEQALFARLAVFVNGATLDAVEAIANASGDLPLSALHTVVSLLDKSLVQRRPLTSPGAEPRLTMLETIREFAQDRLAERPESSAVRRSHAEYYLALAAAADANLLGPEQRLWLDRLEAEHDNLRAALAWTLTSAESFQLGLHLVSVLGQFWYVRGYFSEGRCWLSLFLKQEGANAVWRAKALIHLGMCAVEQADFVQAAEAAQASLTLSSMVGDQSGMAEAYLVLGAAARTGRDFDRSAAFTQQSLDLYRSADDGDGVAQSLYEMASLALRRGDYASARQQYEEVLDQFEQAGKLYHLSTVQYMLAITVRNLGDYARAIQLFEDSLKHCQELGSQLGIGTAILELADCAYAQGQYAQASKQFERSLDLLRALGMKREMAYAQFGLGDIAWAQGDNARATHAYHAAWPLLQDIDDRLALAWGQRRLGRLALTQGDSATAQHHYQASLNLCRTISYSPGLSKAALGLGKVAWHRADTAAARTYFADALQLQRALGNPYDAATLLDAVAVATASQDRADHAAQLLGAADALRSRMGVVLHLPERSAHESLVVHLTQRLSAARYSPHWTAGQSLTLTEAIPLALRFLVGQEPQPRTRVQDSFQENPRSIEGEQEA